MLYQALVDSNLFSEVHKTPTKITNSPCVFVYPIESSLNIIALSLWNVKYSFAVIISVIKSNPEEALSDVISLALKTIEYLIDNETLCSLVRNMSYTVAYSLPEKTRAEAVIRLDVVTEY